jgi:hypothetical protein
LIASRRSNHADITSNQTAAAAQSESTTSFIRRAGTQIKSTTGAAAA